MGKYRFVKSIIAGALISGLFLAASTLQAADSVSPSVLELEKSFVNVIKKVKPTVVDISSKKTITRQAPMSSPFGEDPFFQQFFRQFQQPQREDLITRGSGVIIRNDGYILTNNHVIKDMDKINVTLSDGKSKEAKIIGTDESTDLAVIKIDGDNYQIAELGDSDTIEVGQFVFTFGSPFFFSGSVSHGIISGLGRELGLSNYENLIQTDAAMNPGNSGGPLVNIHGQVIGINKAIATSGQGAQQSAGIGFAIPINLANSVMKDLIKSGKWTKGFLGINMSGEITEDNVKQFKLPSNKGVMVTNVIPKSPAEAAGVQVYDVIIEFNNKPVNSIFELQSVVALTKVGEKVPVKLIRDGKEKILSVTVAERTDDLDAMGKDTNKKWGITVQTLTKEMAKQYGIEFGDGGLLISDVEQNSDAFEIGFRKNDIILEIDRKPVKEIKDFTDSVSSKKVGDKILFRLKNAQGGYKILTFTVPGDKSNK